MIIGDYKLVNEEKLDRAINGSMTRGGVLEGGLAKKYPKPEKLSKEERAEYESALLAEYDRLGGLITKDDCKVVTGSFYDFKIKAQRKEPSIMFVEELDGELIELPEVEVKAIKKAKERVKKVKEKAKKRRKK